MMIPRRRVTGLIVVAGLLGAGCPGAMAASASVAGSAARPARYFSVPAAAFSNGLGQFPAIADCGTQIGNSTQPDVPGTPATDPTPVRTGPCPAGGTGSNAFAYNQPAAQPGLGVPLGGVGAGSFMINQAGSFGPWDFGGAYQNQDVAPSQFENRILRQAAFHVSEQLAGEQTRIRTLAVNAAPWNQLPAAWHTLKAGEGRYSALWPFGWTSYTPFSAGVSMRFWSPIVAGNDELTSMPIAFFDVRLANTTDKVDRISTMFTMPNAPAHDTHTVRTGLTSRVQTDATTGVTAVTLSASSPKNTPDAKDSDWTIAAKPAAGQKVSYVTSWNSSGDGKDIYNAFSAGGHLPNKALDHSSSAGAIAVSATLAPGQVTTIPFALAWDFPQSNVPAADTCNPFPGAACETWSRDPNQYFMRRYTSFLGARETPRNDYVAGSYRFHQGFTIADRMLARHDASLELVRGWWGRIVKNAKYPTWLVRLALNEEIQMVFNQSFWESGLITKTPSPATRIGSAVPDTHLFCTSTGGNWDTCNEWDTDAWGYLAELLLWPSLERDRLRGVIQEAYQGVIGVGETGVTHNSATNALQPVVGRLQFSDVPMATIFRSYAYYRRTGDNAFLKYAYPAMLQMMQVLQKGIRPPDHFPQDLPGQQDSYDAWHAEVHNIYNAQLWLLTEEIMIDATQRARALGVVQATPAIDQQLSEDLPQAKQEFETIFWNPVLGHYTMDPGGAGYQGGYFVDRFFAQQIATTLGLPPLVPLEHEVQDLHNAYPQQMQNKKDGHFIGPPNMAPEVGPTNPAQEQVIEEGEIWPASAMEYAGTFLQAGQAAKDPLLTKQGLEIAHALEYWMVEKVSLGFLFEEPGGWAYDDPSVYRSPSFNQERTTLGVLNTLDPIVKWAVPTTMNGSSQHQPATDPSSAPPGAAQPAGHLPATGAPTAWLSLLALGLVAAAGSVRRAAR